MRVTVSVIRELIRKYIRKSPELMKMEQIELKDDGYSGKNMERPAMQELLSMIKKRKSILHYRKRYKQILKRLY